MAKADATQTVERYFAALTDPESLVPTEAVEQVKADLEKAEGVVERLKLREELRRLEQPDTESIRDDFVAVAKEWAENLGISGESLQAEGADPEDLRRAGFNIATPRSTRRPATRSSSRTSREEVVAAMKDTFTTKDLMESTGASRATVSKAITEEIEAGRVERLGADESDASPGRSAILFKKK